MTKNAPLAQLAEQVTLNHKVVGSSPSWRTKEIPSPAYVAGFFIGKKLDLKMVVYSNRIATRTFYSLSGIILMR
jgi:hypothetical protein